jgi:hypothetical protein
MTLIHSDIMFSIISEQCRSLEMQDDLKTCTYFGKPAETYIKPRKCDIKKCPLIKAWEGKQPSDTEVWTYNTANVGEGPGVRGPYVPSSWLKGMYCLKGRTDHHSVIPAIRRFHTREEAVKACNKALLQMVNTRFRVYKHAQSKLDDFRKKEGIHDWHCEVSK